ncbi:MAG TPA: carbonic anhydrase [Verrucomicrobiae bacterium]|nr:carbonic anhydrase [Verrucomicrobiae bacterium]
MRLFEAILDANQRAIAGDEKAGLRPSEYADSLPVIALTCIDPRLNPLIPEVLGIPEEQFIWLRNAGNIITGPLSSMMRSLALACAVKGGREIVILGHTDCKVGQTSVMQLTERLRALGVDRARLPENLTEYFGVFGSERQNVLRAVEHVRASPLIGPGLPVHGMLVDIRSGRLEWLVNGYDILGKPSAALAGPPLKGIDDWMKLVPFQIGEMKIPEAKIGDYAVKVEQAADTVGHAAEQIGEIASKVGKSPLKHTKAGQWAAKIGDMAEQIGGAAAQVEEWVEKHQRTEQKPAPPPPPPAPSPIKMKPQPPTPREASRRSIPVPPPIIRQHQPRRRGDE